MPNNLACGSCFVVFCGGVVQVDFTHILQHHLSETKPIIILILIAPKTEQQPRGMCLINRRINKESPCTHSDALSGTRAFTWTLFMTSELLMMTSSYGNIFRVTGHLCGEFTGHRWILLTKASDAELWCFFYLHPINGWVNNGEAGDLRRYRAHYDGTVMRGGNGLLSSRKGPLLQSMFTKTWGAIRRHRRKLSSTHIAERIWESFWRRQIGISEPMWTKFGHK